MIKRLKCTLISIQLQTTSIRLKGINKHFHSRDTVSKRGRDGNQMDKITFLNELEQELAPLSKKTRDNQMYDYERYFFEQESNGKNEYQIMGELDSPKQIGKKIVANHAIKNAETEPSMKAIGKAIFASLGLGLVSLLIILLPMIFVGLIVLTFMLMAFGFMSAPLFLIVHSIVNQNMSVAMSNYLFAFSFSGLGIMILVIILKLVQYIYKLIIKYLRWNIGLIKGGTLR